MSIKINLGVWSSVFAVPSKVVDEGLKFADGAKLRVLLYILRNSGKEIDDEMLSKDAGVSKTDIPEVLDYWVSMDILSKSDNVYFPSEKTTRDNFISEKELKTENSNNLSKDTDTNDNFEKAAKQDKSLKAKENINAEKSDEASVNNTEKAKPHFAVSRPQKPDYVFTSQRLKADEELKFLVDEMQSSLRKVLSISDISTVLMLKDTCGLPLDVILMLIQYCISIDKANMRTIEKIGVQWADDGIYSVEAADNKIKQIMQTSKNFSIVSSTFGLKNAGSPTKKQLEYGDKWIVEWKFSREMLREAYERCVDSKGSMNFRYIDGILKRWNSAGVHTLEELSAFESSSSKPQKNRKSSYDIDELEKITPINDFNN